MSTEKRPLSYRNFWDHRNVAYISAPPSTLINKTEAVNQQSMMTLPVIKNQLPETQDV